MPNIEDLRKKIHEIQSPYKDEGKIFYDKMKFKQFLSEHGIHVPKTYLYITNETDIKIIQSTIQKLEEFVLKPNSSARGQDVYVMAHKREKYVEIDNRKHDWEFIRGKIQNMISIHKNILIEERIHCPPTFSELLNRIDGIIDIRMYMLHDDVIFSKMRIPLKSSEGYANTGRRATAMAVSIDGHVTDDNIFDNTKTIHPESMKDFNGYYVPHWSNMLKTARTAAKQFDIPFHSIDITCAYDKQDKTVIPTIIESEKLPLLSHFTPDGCKELMDRL